jgi:hypothetical protein
MVERHLVAPQTDVKANGRSGDRRQGGCTLRRTAGCGAGREIAIGEGTHGAARLTDERNLHDKGIFMTLPNSFAVETENVGMDADASADRATAIDLILQAFESSTDHETVVDAALHQASDLGSAERSLAVQEMITQLGQTMDRAYWHRPHQRRWRA